MTINFLIDIDGTICEDIPNEQPERMKDAVAFPHAASHIKKLYDSNHVITFFTSRTEDMRQVTENWLKENGFLYHSLIMNKPRGGNYVWIDNLNIRAYQYPVDLNWIENY